MSNPTPPQSEAPAPPRPPGRMTVGWLTVVVALVGLWLADVLRARRGDYLERAARSAAAERDYRLSERQLREAAQARPGSAATFGAAADLQRRRAEWHAARRARFWRASETPWSGIGPDPPWPQ